jgi:hypothetical protein
MATTFKVLGQVAPANTSNADLYTVGAGKTAVISTIHVTNVTGTAANARIYVRVNGAAAADSNAFVKDLSVPSNGVYAFTEGITLAASDVLTVQTGTANALTFHVFGQENS